MLGRAIFIADIMNGVTKATSVAMSRTAALLGVSVLALPFIVNLHVPLHDFNSNYVTN